MLRVSSGIKVKRKEEGAEMGDIEWEFELKSVGILKALLSRSVFRRLFTHSLLKASQVLKLDNTLSPPVSP